MTLKLDLDVKFTFCSSDYVVHMSISTPQILLQIIMNYSYDISNLVLHITSPGKKITLYPTFDLREPAPPNLPVTGPGSGCSLSS